MAAAGSFRGRLMIRLALVAALVTVTPALALAHGPEGDTAKAMPRRVTAEGTAEPVGLVTFVDTPLGMLVRPFLRDLGPGPHGAHVHENADCGPGTAEGGVVPGGAAGGHYDPEGTGRHAGPYGDGHLGDLPNLTVERGGTAHIPVLAPRLTVAELEGRSLIVHAGADRYDQHSGYENGKGGRRLYCDAISVTHHKED